MSRNILQQANRHMAWETMTSETSGFLYNEFIPAGQKLAAAAPGEEIVISGISGQFPESSDIYELYDNLMNIGDLITEDNRRWKKGVSVAPRRIGKIPHPEKFDAAAFGIDACSAQCSDPVLRVQLECAVEAVMDAGVHPLSLKGKRVAVIVCGVFSETEVFFLGDSKIHNAFKVCNRTVHAGIISQYLGVNGPAFLADTACSSSMYALDAAYQLIRTGKCDSAIIGGSNFCLRERTSLQFFNLGVLSPDGRCKTFDEEGQGYVRSEAGAMLFLQKAKDAKRVYAHVVHSQTNCDGYKEQGITYPSGHMQEKLLQRFYKECGVNPNSIKFVEAHGTGTKVGDPEEVKAIENIFAKERTINNHLLLGSVKSNIGHTEPVSGVCSIAKVILSFEKGEIPANVNFREPRKCLKAIMDGIMKVVDQHQPYPGGPVPINSFGFGGSNAHTLLSPNKKEKVNGGVANDKLPRLVIASGRSPEAVNSVLTKVETMNPVDAEYVSLLHEVYGKNIPGHMYRGFTIVPGFVTDDRRMIKLSPLERKPKLCLIVSLSEKDCDGAIIKSLMEFPVFSETMRKCSETLLPKGIDLLSAACSLNRNLWIPHHSVTTSLQIGLINMLKVLGVKLYNIVGSSPAKDYATGKITISEALIAAYQTDLEESQGTGKNTLLHSDKNCSFSGIKNGSCNKNEEISLMFDRIVTLELNPQKEMHDSINLLTDSQSILKKLGRLYLWGIDLQLTNLYPKTEYPVSRGTPMISPYIKWDHSDSWFVAADVNMEKMKKLDVVVNIIMKRRENEYLYGHVIDGRNLYPATAYMMMVAETFYQNEIMNFSLAAITFENVRFIRATNIPKDGLLTFKISFSPGTNRFEVIEGGAAVVTGYMKLVENHCLLSDMLEPPLPAAEISMTGKDIYKELRLRGYNYNGLFRSFVNLDPSGCVGSIEWKDNYVAYMDNMLQMAIFSKDTRNLYVPTRIERLTIDFKKHIEAIKKLTEERKVLPVYCWKELTLVHSGGIEICGLNANPIPRRRVIADPVLETYGFMPYCSQTSIGLDDLLQVAVHLALENGPHTNRIKVIELPSDEENEFLSSRIVNILGDLPLLVAEITVLLEPPPADALQGIQFEARDLQNENGCLMLLASGLLSSGKHIQIKHAVDSLIENGCIISKETNGFGKSKQKALADIGANVIMDCMLPGGTDRLIVAKKQWKELSSELKVVDVVCENYSWLPLVQQLLHDGQKNVLLVAQEDKCSGILGLTNCIRRETADGCVRCMFIMDPTAPKFDPNLKFYQDQLSLQLAVNVYCDGSWGSYRHLPIQDSCTLEVSHAFNTAAVIGDLSSFTWLQGPIDPQRDSDIDGFVHIYFSALNFRDIMIASGKLSPDVVSSHRHNQDCLQGLEFSGRDKHGRRVMGVARLGTMASAVIGIPELQWEVPDNWTLEDAATVPVVYSTVIFALKVIAKMQPGCSVLIHAGSGGVGQAAINYCLFHGCTIFTTVGTPQKRKFINETFPQIPDTHIGNSRDTSFEQMIMEQTKGCGVDLVLNSLAEEKLLASVRCVAHGGKFIEIGKFDLASDNKLCVECFSHENSYNGVMLDQRFDSGSNELYHLSKIIADAIKEGSVKPLVRTVFNLNEVEQAYRYLAAGKHIGKVLVNIRPEENQALRVPDELYLKAQSRFYCNPEHSYIIIGGLGGFGLELADWLILRKAKKLILTSRKGISNGYQQSRLYTWNGYGVDVVISTEDVSTEKGVCNLLEIASKRGPVAGIFNLAVDLNDALFENQTPDSFRQSARPKAVATKFLDKWSRVLCPSLSQFVVFSSVSCGRGNVGQTNYGWSNSVMERICEKRVRDGLPALAIQWGAVGDVGLVADMRDDDKDVIIGGTLPQKLASCLSVLDNFLLQSHPVVASMVVAEKRSDFSKSAGILDYVTSMLGIKDVRTVNQNATLAEMGMDSVMAVEIKQTVETTFDVFLTAEDVRNLSLASLEAMANQSPTDKETNTPQIESSPMDTKMFEFSSQLLDLLKRDIVYERGIQLMESLPGIKEVFLFPGMEGTADTFSEFSAKLRAKSAKCLQTGYCERKMSSVSQLAAFFLPHVLNSLQVSGASFVFVGHSYGGLIALELSSLLEAYGHRGVIILLDSSPQYLRKAILRTLGHDCSMAVLMHLLILVGYSKTQIADFQKKCAELTEWTQKLEIALTMLKSSDLGHSVTVRPFLTTVYHRITEMSTYEPSYKRINSDIILIKAKETPHFDENDLYGIEEMSKNSEVHVVDATHFSLLKKQDVVDIINKRIMTQQEKTSDFEIIQKSCFTHQENVICNGYTKQQ